MGASAAWDGNINVEEYVSRFGFGTGTEAGRLQVRDFEDSSEWEIKETMRRAYSDVMIGKTMIGGVLLFPKAITEDVNNIFLSSDNLPVVYASSDVNATANTRRGSMNLTESKALDDGYRFVWEFTPSQGNGTIAAVGLTHKHGGANAYGSEVDDASPFLQVRKMSLELDDADMEILYKVVEVDFENNLLYAIGYASSTVQIYKYRIPVFNVRLNEKLDDTTLTLLDETVLQCSAFKFYGSYTPYGQFIDGKDGYWYGFSNQQNTSGDAEMLWIRIRKSDYSFTEGSWTLSNAAIPAIGSYKYDSYPTSVKRGVIRDSYLYIPAYDNEGIYKINLSNSTDATKIVRFYFGDEAAGRVEQL